jgi:hypothetical protein
VAVRYFCDRCGNETNEGELRVAELSLVPDADVSLELCPACATSVREHLLGQASKSEVVSGH